VLLLVQQPQQVWQALLHLNQPLVVRPLLLLLLLGLRLPLHSCISS
jgi:hypothetical protein